MTSALRRRHRCRSSPPTPATATMAPAAARWCRSSILCPWPCNLCPYRRVASWILAMPTAPSAARRSPATAVAPSRSSQSGNPCGIPSTAIAYSVNVTVVPQGTLGYLTIWPTGEGQPTVSTLNSLDGRIKANAAIVPAGTPNGSVSVFVTNTTNVVLDINGYFTDRQRLDAGVLSAGPVPRGRHSQTQWAAGRPVAHRPAWSATSRCWTAVADCRAAPRPTRSTSPSCPKPPRGVGYLTVWPHGQTQPVVSTLNDLTNTIVANAGAGAGGHGRHRDLRHQRHRSGH